MRFGVGLLPGKEGNRRWQKWGVKQGKLAIECCFEKYQSLLNRSPTVDLVLLSMVHSRAVPCREVNGSGAIREQRNG